MAYKPSEKILDKYAKVLINFALNSGKGVKKGEVVRCIVPDVAKPFYGHLQKAILKAGAMPMMRLYATGFDKQFFELANEEQLTFFPKELIKTRVKLVDHTVAILADHNLHELRGVNPKKIFLATKKNQQIRDWYNAKEYAGKYTWTIGLYGTAAMAREAKLTLKDYWNQIIKACYLDFADPVARWKRNFKEIERVKRTLKKLPIEKLNIKGKNIDLWLTLGEKRKWLGGMGRNIPSFEVFTSPDWRGTEGYISFNEPLYRFGNLIKDIRLEFEKGKVVKATAKKEQKMLREMLAQKDADKVGEFSLTDSRLSRISKFMANTLYDENIGGKYGNTHIAVGMSYRDALDGDPTKVSEAEWKKMGFNNSSIHTDIMSTEDRTVTAILKNGKRKVIYQKGRFTV